MTGELELQWARALAPLLPPAAEGLRSVEARVLYDLQRFVDDAKRDPKVFNFTEWVLWLGKVPMLREELLAREVKLLGHLRDAVANLRRSTLPHPSRTPLDRLLTDAVHKCEKGLHDQVAPLISRAIADAKLKAENVPEQVAHQNLTAELADRIVSHGRLAFSDVRDSVSRHQLKLPDVTNPIKLESGDEMLHLDRCLALALPGVYRRAEIYFRWLQTFSSFFFGTRAGRFLTLFLILPFGAAFLILAFLQHLAEPIAHAYGGDVDLTVWPAILGLGLVIFALLHWTALRRGVLHALEKLGDAIAQRWSHRLAPSRPTTPPPYARLIPSFLFESFLAALLVGLLCVVLNSAFYITLLAALVTLVLVAALLNSPVGRPWRNLTSSLLAGFQHVVWTEFLQHLGRTIHELFKEVMDFLERFYYWADEQVRFGPTNNTAWMAAKACLSLVVSAIIYVLRFVVLLLLEPQINPLKHFPTVTVAHKVLLPLVPALERVLAPHFDPFLAWALAFGIILCIPGIFGFFVWEMSSNWRLYRANRAKNLHPIRVGSHGERVPNLLRPGLHSGTLPRLFARWHAAEVSRRHEFEDKLYHVEEEVRHFASGSW